MIGTVDEELAACRERMRGATHALRLHHAGPLMEPVTEDIERRLAFILMNKPAHEWASRFYHMLPVSPEVYAEWRDALDAEWKMRRAAVDVQWWTTRDAPDAEFHARVCTLADCAWDGRRIVFPEAVQV